MQELVQPGFTRVSFLQLYSAAETKYILSAIEFVATKGWLFLPQYRPSVSTAAWVHIKHDSVCGNATTSSTDGITCEPLAAFETRLQQAVTGKESNAANSMAYNVCTLTGSEEAQLLAAVQVCLSTDIRVCSTALL